MNKGETITLLFTITTILVIVGVTLYSYSYVGWAQLFWVLASGTAGAGCARWVD